MAKKSGWRTTEFWVSVLTTVAAVGSSVVGFIPASAAAVVGTVSAAAYAVSRGLAKAKEETPK